MTIEANMNEASVQTIKVGDVILPPEREIRLWMGREMAERGLRENALYLTVVEVREGKPDKKGRWVVVKGSYSKEWTLSYANPERDYFCIFKARPQTPWRIL